MARDREADLRKAIENEEFDGLADMVRKAWRDVDECECRLYESRAAGRREGEQFAAAALIALFDWWSAIDKHAITDINCVMNIGREARIRYERALRRGASGRVALQQASYAVRDRSVRLREVSTPSDSHEMRAIPKGSGRGSWLYSHRCKHRAVHFSCPGCGTSGTISETHEIAADGTVSPSVQCDCGYHEYVKLEGFD